MHSGPQERPWLAVTGQRWKAWGSMALVLTGGAGFVASILGLNGVIALDDRSQLRAIGAGMLLVATGFTLLAWSVRCQVCGCRAAWYLMRTAHAGNWYMLLASVLGCPKCGHRPEDPAESGQAMSSRVG